MLTWVWVCALPASIFAYGMTSSGKTYTMKGVTELAVGDIFSRIHKVGPDRCAYTEGVTCPIQPIAFALLTLDHQV